MIKLTIVNGSCIYLNCMFIEMLEACTSDNNNTVVRIHNGTTYVVNETPEEIIASVQEWHRKCRSKK